MDKHPTPSPGSSNMKADAAPAAFVDLGEVLKPGTVAAAREGG
jgi:hypothetical protein